MFLTGTPKTCESRLEAGGGHDLVHREDESLTAAAGARTDAPSARADASAQVRSRSA